MEHWAQSHDCDSRRACHRQRALTDGLSQLTDRNVIVRIEGIDRQQVGQFAANVRAVRPPEPYKGKGVRYVDEHVRRKVGKAGATAG